MSSRLRKYHPKSRNGCRRCKRRRVKCDCIGPICSNCRRRGDTCSYSTSGLDDQPAASPPNLTSTNAGPNAGTNTSRTEQAGLLPLGNRSSPSPFEPLPNYLGFSEGIESQLMNHFLSNVYFTLSLHQDPEGSHLWATLIQSVAAECDFVKQSILAASATHIYRLGRVEHRQRYYLLSCKHTTVASSRFRSSVMDISDANWLETIVFSINLAVVGFSTPFFLDKVLPREERSTDLFEQLVMMRCAGGILNKLDRFASQSSVLQGLAATRKFYEGPEIRQILEQVHRRLQALASQLKHGEDSMAPTFILTIESLASWINLISGVPKSWRDFIVWPTSLSNEYLERLRADCPTALEIFLQWCVIMKQTPTRWYLHPWLDHGIELVRTRAGGRGRTG